MLVDAVVDASVLGAAFFNEDRSREARAWLAVGHRLAAPELLRLEIASIAAKKVWRGEVAVEVGDRAANSLDQFVATFASGSALAEHAYRLARDHRFSAYDGAYVALAISTNRPLITLDEKLITRANEAGLEDRVRGLS